MDTQNVGKAHTGGICPPDDEQCLKVSGGLKIRWMGLEMKGQGHLGQAPFPLSTRGGDRNGRVPP